jgi:galactokinase
MAAAAPAMVRAPGRVNIIGDHTDYQDGFCLPMAIDRDVRIAYRPRSDGRIDVHSDALTEADAPAFEAMVRATARALDERGRPPVGLEAVVTSTVPIGAGLSSSAAVEVALCLAFAGVAGWTIEGRDLALLAQQVEHEATGVPCGVLDQMASVFGVEDHALLLDCRTLEVEPIAIPDRCTFLVVDSAVVRQLSGSEYADRRAACEAAAARLGVPALRDATLDQVAGDPIAHHVVSENARTLAFADALRRGDLDVLGPLMLGSHISMRDDFGASVVPVDILVDICMEHDARGARMTGGGFGGCVVALFVDVADEDVNAAALGILAEYRAATGIEGTGYRVRAAAGAGPVELQE